VLHYFKQYPHLDHLPRQQGEDTGSQTADEAGVVLGSDAVVEDGAVVIEVCSALVAGFAVEGTLPGLDYPAYVAPFIS